MSGRGRCSPTGSSAAPGATTRWTSRLSIRTAARSGLAATSGTVPRPYPTETLAYARVDLLPAADGPVVLEVELTEPSLFLGYEPAAAGRLADAIAAAL